MKDRLTDAELDSLEYHGCSSGTPTPSMVRDAIVKATTELKQRRAIDLFALSTTMGKLHAYVRKFVDDMKLSGPESIHQSDKPQEEAPSFLEKCAEIVGFYEYGEDE